MNLIIINNTEKNKENKITTIKGIIMLNVILAKMKINGIPNIIKPKKKEKIIINNGHI